MGSFIEAFLLVFVAEMGDKSQLLSLAFATKYKLSVVIPGIALGIGLNHGLAILFASFISNYLSLDIIKLVAALVFIVFGLTSLKLEYEEEEEEKNFLTSLGPIATIAGTFFVGELGDKTQILAMTMGAMATNKLLVFIATFSSMMLVSIIGIFVGRFLKKKIPEVTMKLIAAIMFLFFGVMAFKEALEIYNMPMTYLVGAILLIVLLALMIIKGNEKRKDEYFINEIIETLNNCVGCEESVCACETKTKIEELTNGYLGGETKFLGNMINYLEDLKKISPKRYVHLYNRILDDGLDTRILPR